MGFLIAAICIGVLSIVFAIESELESFLGGLVLCVIFIVCWFVWKKKKRQKPEAHINSVSSVPTNVYPTQVPTIQPKVQNVSKQGSQCQDYTQIQPVYGTQAGINPALQRQYKTENHHVAGTAYRQREIESLGQENPVYDYSKKELIDEGYEDEKIYYYDFYPDRVELIEEPGNEHDPNAIKVVVDGVHIGYIKAGSCPHIKKLIHAGSIVKTDVEIRGGKYKYLYCEYDDEKEKDVYTLERDESDYFATVTIQYVDK